MANYLVTGAAGFIGARVSELLLQDGHTVLGVDDLNDAYDVRLKEWRLKRLAGQPGFRLFQQDLRDYQRLKPVFESGPIDAVINLAARAGVRYSVENPFIYLETNNNAVLNLLEQCKIHGVPKFILASTSSIYGLNAPMPTPEETNSDHPLQPYSASKKGAEAMCHAYHFLHGLDVTIFRFFTVYGPAGRPDMVMFRFCQWIAEGRPVHLNGDGEQTRGFTYVDDIARGTILGLKPLGYEIINLGGHEVISINEMISVLEELIGKKANVVFHEAHKADMLSNWADVSKARRMLGWEPQVSLREGMRRLVEWYMQEREWTSQVLTP
ncbi:nucleotide sugar epimerase [Ornatilinea apprima]|uniref:Nucleotide sugar epimerase n=1 Tax=Ornatilinea apprima TaxID=1134406 RepID=A0A0P6Y4L8_9CHLR|nr:GDP-mannose 4,6-dehydratase [Ornatilinea apprima]KPL80047.1 nucleotide sugar epimerase [Ornatilinea apprima]